MVISLHVYVLNDSLLLAKDDVPRVNDSWDDPETGEKNVDEEVTVASNIQKHSDWRKENCKDGEKNLAHFVFVSTRLELKLG